MSRTSETWFGTIDAPEGARVMAGLWCDHRGFGLVWLPLGMFPRGQRGRLRQGAEVEVWKIGRRIKARLVET